MESESDTPPEIRASEMEMVHSRTSHSQVGLGACATCGVCV